MQELYDQLQAERFNSQALSVYDLLRKDYKDWNMNGYRVGISSVLLDMTSFVCRNTGNEGSIPCTTSLWADENNLDVLICMHASTKDGCFSRQLMVFSRSKNLHQDLVNHLCQHDIDLQLEPDSVSDSKLCEQKQPNKPWIAACFHQRNSMPSRKKVQPCVSNFFCKYSQSQCSGSAVTDTGRL